MSLRELKNELSRAFPAEMQGHEILVGGRYSVVTGNDHVVTKYLRADTDEEYVDFLRMQFARETEVIGKLGDIPFVDIEIPQLVSSLEELAHPDFLVRYSMTSIPGHVEWFDIDPDPGCPVLTRQYRELGRLLARFHDALRGRDIGDALTVGLVSGLDVVPVPYFSDEVNKRLKDADAYLKAHLRAGNIHGDSNLSNIVERDEKAKGLLDFSFAGHSVNMETEFWAIPSAYLDPVIEGYEEVSGYEIRGQVYATDLAIYSYSLANWQGGFTTERLSVEENFDRALRVLEGYL